MSEPEPSQPQPPTPRSRVGFARTILLYTRGLIYNQHLRRLTMFYSVLAAMIVTFAGDAFLGDWLHAKLVRFVVWLLICIWLTTLPALLALYDLILLRVQHRLARRELRERLAKELDERK